MTESTYLSDFKENLMRLRYQEAEIPDILDQLDTVLTEIDFLGVKTKIDSAQQEPAKMAGLLQDLMTSLEPLGYYRPDIPTPLLKLLINGLNLRHEDIFAVLDNAHITEVEKKNEKEFLASCAAITQLGYLLISGLIPDIKAGSTSSIINNLNSDIILLSSSGNLKENSPLLPFIVSQNITSSSFSNPA